MYIKNASSFFLCSKKSTKSNLPRKNITCTSKCIFTVPLQQKKYKIKFALDEYHMYIKNASSFFLCSKKSTKSKSAGAFLHFKIKVRVHGMKVIYS